MRVSVESSLQGWGGLLWSRSLSGCPSRCLCMEHLPPRQRCTEMRNQVEDVCYITWLQAVDSWQVLLGLMAIFFLFRMFDSWLSSYEWVSSKARPLGTHWGVMEYRSVVGIMFWKLWKFTLGLFKCWFLCPHVLFQCWHGTAVFIQEPPVSSLYK